MRLEVRLAGHLVGELVLDRDLTSFRFSESYLALADRPVLGRWYEDRLAADFVEKRSQNELPPFFQNYLPERGGALRTFLAEHAGVSSGHEAKLLAALGADLPGAVVVRAVGEGASLDEDGVEHVHRDVAPTGALRFSLAGMQLKFSIVDADDKLTFPATGTGGRWIVKLPSRGLPRLPENEHWTLRWAEHSGIVVPKARLASWREIENLPRFRDGEPAESECLVIERYDRPQLGGARVHQEDFAQILGKRPEEKYGNEARVTFDRMGKILATVCGEDDFDAYLDRLVFMVLSLNPDAHLKNWSVIYPDGRRPRLSPAYDLVSGAPYAQPTDETELACKLAGEWRLRAIRAHHFGVLADHAGLDPQRGAQRAKAAETRIRAAWAALSRSFPSAYRSATEAHLRTVGLA